MSSLINYWRAIRRTAVWCTLVHVAIAVALAVFGPAGAGGSVLMASLAGVAVAGVSLLCGVAATVVPANRLSGRHRLLAALFGAAGLAGWTAVGLVDAIMTGTMTWFGAYPLIGAASGIVSALCLDSALRVQRTASELSRT